MEEVKRSGEVKDEGGEGDWLDEHGRRSFGVDMASHG